MAEKKYITVNDIDNKVFTSQVRGYNKDEVDDFLDALAAQMRMLVGESQENITAKNELAVELDNARAENGALAVQVAELTDKVKELEAALEAASSAAVPAAPAAAAPAAVSMPEDAAYYRNLETTLRETLLGAQRIADNTIAEAKRAAEAAVAEANAVAETTVAEARRQANDMLAAAETEAATVASNAKVEAEAVRAENEKVRQATADYRARIKALIREQLDVFQLDESLFE